MLEQPTQNAVASPLLEISKSWLARSLDNLLSTEGWNIHLSEVLPNLDPMSKVFDLFSFDLVRLYKRNWYESVMCCHPTNIGFNLPYWSIHFPADFNIYSCRLLCLFSITSSFWTKAMCFWALELLSIKWFWYSSCARTSHWDQESKHRFQGRKHILTEKRWCEMSYNT